MAVLSLAVATSRFPELFRSATATETGLAPTATELAVKVPTELPGLFKRIETVLLPLLATAMSSVPSWLKSPTATESGLAPTETVMGVAQRVPKVLGYAQLQPLGKIETLPLP